jgi:hypothetical protein
MLKKLTSNPLQLTFAEVLAHIDANYNFTPTLFTNGTVTNQAGENNGSCKVFQFAILQQLTKIQTLQLFAEHYANVIDNPQLNNHANIRNFMQYGFEGLKFEQVALTLK